MRRLTPRSTAGRRASASPCGRARWRVRLGPALAATAALAAGLVIGALAINGGTNTVTRTQTIEAAVLAPGYHATAVLRKAGSHVVLVITGMPAPPPESEPAIASAVGVLIAARAWGAA